MPRHTPHRPHQGGGLGKHVDTTACLLDGGCRAADNDHAADVVDDYSGICVLNLRLCHTICLSAECCERVRVAPSCILGFTEKTFAPKKKNSAPSEANLLSQRDRLNDHASQAVNDG